MLFLVIRFSDCCVDLGIEMVDLGSRPIHICALGRYWSVQYPIARYDFPAYLEEDDSSLEISSFRERIPRYLCVRPSSVLPLV